MFRSLLVSGCRWKLEPLKDKAWDRCGDLYFSGGSKQLGQRLQVKAGEWGEGQCGGRVWVQWYKLVLATWAPESDGPRPESQLSILLWPWASCIMPLSLHFNICEMRLSQTVVGRIPRWPPRLLSPKIHILIILSSVDRTL